MKLAFLAATAAAAFLSASAGAETVLNTGLQNQGGTVGAPGARGVVTPSTRTTTTDATGTRTTVSANPGADNAAANRGAGTPVAGSWYQDNVGMGSTVGITTDYADRTGGNGSAYFSQVQAQNGKADLQYYFGSSAALSTLTGFTFDYLRGASSTTTQYFVPVLRLNIFKDGVGAGTLVYERAYNAGLGAVTPDTWITDAGTLTSGNWWNTSASLGTTPQTVGKTLQQWIDDNGGSALTVVGVQLGFGSGWNGTFTGAVDNVGVTFANGPQLSADFEVAADAAVPEPATWALMLAGFGAVGVAARRRRTAVRFA